MANGNERDIVNDLDVYSWVEAIELENDDVMIENAVDRLTAGKVIAWHQVRVTAKSLLHRSCAHSTGCMIDFGRGNQK